MNAKEIFKGAITIAGSAIVALFIVAGLIYVTFGQDKPKPAPKEVTIPEARQDKVKLLQKEAEVVELKQRDLYNRAIQQLQASPEWKALEAEATETGRKFSVELQSALKLAGVNEKDFGKYSYSKDTLKFTLVPPKAEDKKE